MIADFSRHFHKILIANRGEIALRVIRTARTMGYRTVAVYSSADREARHAVVADQAVAIGEPAAARSYLNIEAIVAAALKSGADAVHPGYGFLAENADFAEACRQAGLVFIGPSPDAIRAMGNKASAKRLMLAAGVPCVPGYQGADQGEATLLAEARAIGFPVMIKATAGGGGRGMRLVAAAKHFVESLRSARSEAQGAFGSPEVIVERAIIDPRHIEIQIFADRHGNAIYLGERDCSVQRRHQKLIEETPSPVVGDALRARMGSAAVVAAKAIGYEGAGTLEFLLDTAGNFYFMEMNTRLQVEHPVTEAISGLDLVEWQIRVASGEPLPLDQNQVRFQGHAIEVRLCAEDSTHGFVPQSGVMSLWQTPKTLRVEHALESGTAISPYYDSMVAKLVSHGVSREEARRKLLAALEDLVALGVTTNQSFLKACLSHPVFASGEATTGFIDTHSNALLKPIAEDNVRAHVLAAVLIYVDRNADTRNSSAASMSHRSPIPFRLEVDSHPIVATLLKLNEDHYSIGISDHRFEVRVVNLERNRVRFELDGLVESAAFLRDRSELLLQYRAAAYRIVDQTHAAPAIRAEGESDGKIRAVMNGQVLAVHVSVGDSVKSGEPVVTLEAMKMEHIHTAPVTGTVLALHVAIGERATTHRVLAEIGATDAKQDRTARKWS